MDEIMDQTAAGEDGSWRRNYTAQIFPDCFVKAWVHFVLEDSAINVLIGMTVG